MDRQRESYEGVFKDAKADLSKAKKVDARFTGEIKRKIFHGLMQLDGVSGT